MFFKSNLELNFNLEFSGHKVNLVLLFVNIFIYNFKFQSLYVFIIFIYFLSIIYLRKQNQIFSFKIKIFVGLGCFYFHQFILDSSLDLKKVISFFRFQNIFFQIKMLLYFIIIQY
jgi:hypothetical protein